jgi:hypothetical protein
MQPERVVIARFSAVIAAVVATVVVVVAAVGPSGVFFLGTSSQM